MFRGEPEASARLASGCGRAGRGTRSAVGFRLEFDAAEIRPHAVNPSLPTAAASRQHLQRVAANVNEIGDAIPLQLFDVIFGVTGNQHRDRFRSAAVFRSAVRAMAGYCLSALQSTTKSGFRSAMTAAAAAGSASAMAGTISKPAAAKKFMLKAGAGFAHLQVAKLQQQHPRTAATLGGMPLGAQAQRFEGLGPVVGRKLFDREHGSAGRQAIAQHQAIGKLARQLERRGSRLGCSG